MKISVITPTIWASGALPRIVDILERVAEVSEVIVVDNCPSKSEGLKGSKLSVIKMKKNIFVNPAWNLAVKRATGEVICFLCDDVVPNPKLFRFVLDLYERSDGIATGMVGLDWNNPGGELAATAIGWRTSNWFGGIWFIKRADYSAIPLTKIWFGEDWNMVKTLNRGMGLYEVRGFSGQGHEESASIKALGGLKGRIGWVLRMDKYIWSILLKPLLALDRLCTSGVRS
jgi:glycosyltransferase involved in cell wall biosynthesis